MQDDSIGRIGSLCEVSRIFRQLLCYARKCLSRALILSAKISLSKAIISIPQVKNRIPFEAREKHRTKN